MLLRSNFLLPSSDFYEEMFNLVDLFTTSSVSTEMWQMFPILYETFTKDGFDYFVGRFALHTCVEL